MRMRKKRPSSLAPGTIVTAMMLFGVGQMHSEWDRRFFSAGINGEVNAIATRGSELFVGGDFISADAVGATNVAHWTGFEWGALGSGIKGVVQSIALNGDNVYVGGTFSVAGDVRTSHVARWDGSQWTALGAGIQGLRVTSLLFDEVGMLYVGGQFTNAGNVAAINIARWDGTRWSALGAGLSNDPYEAWVNTLVWHENNLYAGGFFTESGRMMANCIARWDGTEWFALGAGVDDRDYLPQVTTMVVYENDLHVGGAFALAGNTTVGNVAKWDGSSWSGLGGGLERYFGNIPATTLAIHDGKMLVGGNFTAAGTVDANNLACWDGSRWTEFAGGMDGEIKVASAAEGQTYLGGALKVATAGRKLGLARWADPEWQNLSGGGGLGMSGPRTCAGICWGDEVTALVAMEDSIFAAGGFDLAGSTMTTNVARWDGIRWWPVGGGFNGPLFALAVGDGELFAGGQFDSAGGKAATGIASWDGSTWSPLGSGIDGSVRAFAFSDGRLYVGGNFEIAGGIPAENIACWDGVQWSPLGHGVNGPVHALVATNNIVYAGGNFKVAGSVAATNLAVWNGSNWSGIHGGVYGVVDPTIRFRPPPVSSLLLRENQVYVGGDFAFAGGVPATNVACWTGTSWISLGNGLLSTVGHIPQIPPATVATFWWHEDKLYAGGNFSRTGDISVHGISCWNGLKWDALDEGIRMGSFSPPSVQALCVANHRLYVGGHFQFSGGSPSSDFSIWHMPPPISIERIIDRIQASWPATASGYVLQMNTNLAENHWLTISNGVEIQGDLNIVTHPITDLKRFYRLKLEPGN